MDILSDNIITKKALDWNPQGKRKRGRPRGTRRRVVERDINDRIMTFVSQKS